MTPRLSKIMSWRFIFYTLIHIFMSFLEEMGKEYLKYEHVCDSILMIHTQKLLEKYKYPHLSIDHLKMGLIRSGNTTLTPISDNRLLTDYLWPIVCEMIKTAIGKEQNQIPLSDYESEIY